MRCAWRRSALAVALLWSTSSVADPEVRIAGAIASSTDRPEDHAVWRLFDLDDATTFCAREKVHVTVTLKLTRPAHLRSLTLTLGDPTAWRERPRVKQVFATVSSGEKVAKKIRHKWPDHPEPGEGRINLGTEGDTVVLELDQAYAGSGTGGLCIGGVRIDRDADGAVRPVDMAELAALSWSDEERTTALAHRYDVVLPDANGEVHAALELTKAGKFDFRDDAAGLRVEGKFYYERIAGGDGVQLVFEAQKAKLGKAKLDVPQMLAPHAAPWRFLVREGEFAATFVPWVAYVVGKSGELELASPRDVAVQ